MPPHDTARDKERDARHNEAARQELVRRDRQAGLTRNLERAIRLHAEAEQFAAAFAREASCARCVVS